MSKPDLRSENPANPTRATTVIEVAKVKPASDALPEVPFPVAVEKLLGVRYPPQPPDCRDPATRPGRTIEACSGGHDHLVAGPGLHPVVAAIHNAFQNHRPLVLSPDIIWLVIAQGFANHVNANVEALRSQFVKHAGKVTITVRRDDFIKGSPENPWPEVFEEFTTQVREHIGTATHDLLLPTFSTTGPVERAAAQVVLLDAMQSYFAYGVFTMCGIPQIILEGTADDWQSVTERTQGLSRFGLEWWTEPLVPILKEFELAVRGEANTRFWRSIYKFNSHSGGASVTGWITALFPYLKDCTGLATVMNPWLAKGGRELRRLLGLSWRGSGPSLSVFPSGLARAPFEWNCLGTIHEMEFLGGFVGVRQDADTLRLRPEIGWAVRDFAIVRALKAEYEAAYLVAKARSAADRAEAEAKSVAAQKAKEEFPARRTVTAPCLDPARPRHEQFFRFVCPICDHAEEIGLWFPYKECSRCGAGCRIVRPPG